jgi:hypothetical protein
MKDLATSVVALLVPEACNIGLTRWSTLPSRP